MTTLPADKTVELNRKKLHSAFSTFAKQAERDTDEFAIFEAGAAWAQDALRAADEREAAVRAELEADAMRFQFWFGGAHDKVWMDLAARSIGKRWNIQNWRIEIDDAISAARAVGKVKS